MRTEIPPRGAVEELPRIFRFPADAGECVGTIWDATTGRFSGSGGEATGPAGVRQTPGAAQHRLRS